VDLIISSNGASDGTADVLKDLGELSKVRVVVQPVNYGMHIHLAWLYGQAQGKYLWMIGDDDLVEPILLERICEKLREEPDLGWIHLPHAFYQRDADPVYSLRPDRTSGTTAVVNYFLPTFDGSHLLPPMSCVRNRSRAN
jgi:glycosyltransferase involved in cell wall biosynthesis